MRVMVIGCGKLGSALALELFRKGNDVTVVDKDAESFFALGSDFNGNTVVGVGFDKEVLEDAGIQFQDAVVCSTDSDEANALAGRIAKDIYMIPRVVARLNDPMKARIFETLGIRTVSTTGYGVDRAMELLSLGKLDAFAALGEHGDVELVRIAAPSGIWGAAAGELSAEPSFRLVAIIRGSSSFIPNATDEIKTDDILYFAVKTADRPKLKTALGI